MKGLCPQRSIPCQVAPHSGRRHRPGERAAAAEGLAADAHAPLQVLPAGGQPQRAPLDAARPQRVAPRPLT